MFFFVHRRTGQPRSCPTFWLGVVFLKMPHHWLVSSDSAEVVEACCLVSLCMPAVSEAQANSYVCDDALRIPKQVRAANKRPMNRPAAKFVKCHSHNQIKLLVQSMA